MPGRGKPWSEGGLPDSTVTSPDIKDLDVGTSDIANGAVWGIKLGFFKSPPIPMTGAPVLIPHGLGRVPAKVTVTIVDGPGVYAPPMITEGVHTPVDVVVIGTPGWFVVVEAT